VTRAGRLAALLLAAAASLAPALPATPPPGAAPATNGLDVAALERTVAEVRELPWKHPVTTRRVSRGEALGKLREMLAEELPADRATRLATLLGKLGLLPEDYPLAEKLGELLEEQVAGFYVARDDTLYVPELDAAAREALGGNLDLARRTILAHELDHALTDQHFDLEKLLEDPTLRERDDLLFARKALAEGDATLLMMLVMMRDSGLPVSREAFPSGATLRGMFDLLGSGLYPKLDEAPPWLRDQLVEPYVLGLELVVDTWKAGGWKAVDALWKRPPASTEQFLHPERRDDAPTPVTLPPWRGREPLVTVELGELGARGWLAAVLPRERAEAAAAGWDGDRAGLWRAQDGTWRVRWRSTWDTEEDAREFAVAARERLAGKAPAACTWRVARSGKDVEVAIEGLPPVRQGDGP